MRRDVLLSNVYTHVSGVVDTREKTDAVAGKFNLLCNRHVSIVCYQFQFCQRKIRCFKKMLGS